MANGIVKMGRMKFIAQTIYNVLDYFAAKGIKIVFIYQKYVTE